MGLQLKDPGAVVDYAIDWATEYLGADSLANSDWSISPIEPDGLAVTEHNFDLGMSTVKVSGGVAGHVYRLINHVELASGRQDSRSFDLRVEAR